MLLSVTEGEDKPLKYPTIFNTPTWRSITKIDLAEAVEFDWDAALANIQAVRPGMRTLGVSAKTGAGMNEYLALLESGLLPRARRGGSAAARSMTSLLAVCVLGFFLGMRHATDPDHVIAVTTIVSRLPDDRARRR